MEEKKLPDLKLLSLLEKMAKPIESCTFNLELGGLFAFPEEWKTMDDLNPGLFSYKASFEGASFTDGKIIVRELTDQEKKDLEEAALKKKGGAAAAAANKKSQAEIPQLSPEELEMQQRLEEEKLEAERKAKEEWDALTEQERYYRTREDKYKNDSLKWENNQVALQKEGEELAALEEEVSAGGAWLYVTRFITAPEEDIAKFRKGKPPKGVNTVDLNPCNMRAWIDYTEFQTPGVSEIVGRAKLERFINPEEKPEEFPNPNLEKTYVLVRINLDPAITPLVTEVQPRVEDMVPRPLPIPKMPTTSEVVNEYKGQLVLVMESLALEYSSMFAKEMTSAQETKAKHMSNQQKRDIREKRKDRFVSEFDIAKYNVLKEKMKKSILKVIRDKYQKSGPLTGINADSKDQFYSELYTFLTEQMRQTLNDLMNEKAEKKDDFPVDLIESMRTANAERNNVKATIEKEPEINRELRLAQENELVNHLIESEKAYKNLLSLDPENHENSYAYCQFLIKRRNFPKAEEILNEAIRYSSNNRNYTLLLACLQARRGRSKEAISILNSLLDKDPFDSLSNTLMAFICTKLSNEPKLGKKHLAISQRLLMRKLGLLPPKASPHSLVIDSGPTFKMPSMQQTPDENVAKKIVLTDDQNDEIWIEAAEYLVKSGIVDLAAQVIEEIKDKTTPKIEFFNAQIAFINGEVNTSIDILNRLIKQNPKSHEYLITKAYYCFEKDKYYEAEETFLQAFRLKTNVKTFPTFLRLGYTFLYRKAWTDARAVLTKACELKTNSSLGWLGLGIACLRTGEYNEGEQALTQANVYDPLNAEVWGYLALLCLHDNGRMVQANQALREMLKCDLQNVELLEELADKLVGHGKNDVAETLYKKLIESWNERPFGTPNTIGNIFSKLAKIYHGQDRLVDARLYYTEALKYLEGETDKEKVELTLGDIKNILEGGGFNN